MCRKTSETAAETTYAIRQPTQRSININPAALLSFVISRPNKFIIFGAAPTALASTNQKTAETAVAAALIKSDLISGSAKSAANITAAKAPI